MSLSLDSRPLYGRERAEAEREVAREVDAHPTEA